MRAGQLGYIVGVDPNRDSHAFAVVHVLSGAVVFESTVAASSDGYAHALALVEEHSAGRRAFAIEGTGTFGAALTRFLTGRGERVCSRSEGCGESVARAAKPTRSMPSVPPGNALTVPIASGEAEAIPPPPDD
jgi:hypothetical protein